MNIAMLGSRDIPAPDSTMPSWRLFFLYFCLCDRDLLMGFHALVRQVQRAARRRGYDTRRVVAVGAGPAAQAILAAIDTHGPPDVLVSTLANRAS
jgi:CoA-binding domain